ncbi:MAG: carboxypeptidase regulatory-like domain-containing protein [Myxococcota bacterium]
MRTWLLVIGASAALAVALCLFLIASPDSSVPVGPRTDVAALEGPIRSDRSPTPRRSILPDEVPAPAKRTMEAQLTVLVRGVDGALAGARVLVSVGEDEERTGLTGSGGEARFEDLPSGSMAGIYVEASGFLSATTERPLPEHGEEVAVVHLERASGLSGFVARFEGGPARNVPVRLEGGFGPKVVRTDPRGRFRFEGARAGERLVAEDDQGARAIRVLDEQALGAGFVVLRLQPAERPTGAGVVAGTVTDVEGAPLVEATVVARRGHRFAWSTATGEDGRFELFVPSEGTYTVVADAAGARDRKEGVAAGTLDLALVVVRPGGAIEGRVVRDDGEPAPAFTLRWAQAGGRSARRFVTDPSGVFEIEGLEAGSWTVEATGAGGAAGRSRTVDVPEAGRTFVELRLETPGRLVGTVVDEEGGPIAEALVQLESRPGLGPTPSTRTDPSGAFELAGITPGRRSVSAGARGFRRRIVSGFEVASGETLGPIEIALAPRGEDGPELDLVGIGAVLAPRSGASGLALLVREVVAGGGAAEGGLGPGAVILTIDGRSIDELGFDGAIQAIRGREGTTVQLGVTSDGRDGPVEVVNLLRRRIST